MTKTELVMKKLRKRILSGEFRSGQKLPSMRDLGNAYGVSTMVLRKVVEQLEQEAQLGRRYLAALRREVVRLSGLTRNGVDHRVMVSITEKLEEPELLELKRVYAEQAAERFPLMTQLGYREGKQEPVGADGAFLI